MISPLSYFGLKKSQDFNCWDLARLVYQKEFGISLSPHCLNHAEDGKGLARAALDERAKPCWKETPLPEPCGLVLMGKRGLRYHVGVLITSGMVMHLIDNGGVVVQSLAEVRKGFDNITFFHHVEIHHR